MLSMQGVFFPTDMFIINTIISKQVDQLDPGWQRVQCVCFFTNKQNKSAIRTLIVPFIFLGTLGNKKITCCPSSSF